MMPLILRVCAVAIALSLASPIAAQQALLLDAMGSWTQQTGIYISGPAQRLLAQQLALEFSRNAQAAGFGSADAGSLTGLMGSTLHLNLVPDGKWGGIATPNGVVSFSSIDQRQLVSRIYSVQNINLYLEQFAVVQLNVQPVPPRDYSVFINGEPCPTTERALYKVPPGASTVSITRPPAPVCIWQGQIASRQTVVVPCNF